MKMMKKIMVVCLSLGMVIGAVGCSKPSKTENETSNDINTEKTAQTDEKVEIEIHVWDMGPEGSDNPERALIEIYEDQNPNVDIVITETPEGEDYSAIIASRAAANDLPDIFMWGNNVDVIANGWAANLTEFTSNDPEWSNLVEPLKLGVGYNDRVYLLPKKMNLMGMFINKEIYAENNLKPLEFGYTMDELLYAIEKTTTATTKGTSNYFPVETFYPMVMNPEKYGFATYDGENVNFNTPEYAEGIEIYKKITDNNWNLRNTTTEEFFGRSGWEFGEIGGIGNQYEGTWFFESEHPIDVDYVGLPNGISGVLVNDYLTIASSSKVKEEAYEFAKFMSFGLEGIRTRMELAEANPELYAYRGIPVIAGADAEIDTKFKEVFKEYPGFLAAYDAIDTAKLEGYKEIPGLSMAVNDNDTGVQGTNAEGAPESYKMWKLRDELILGKENLSGNKKDLSTPYKTRLLCRQKAS